MIQLINENDVFYITPTIKTWKGTYLSGEMYELWLEFTWLKWTLSIRLYRK